MQIRKNLKDHWLPWIKASIQHDKLHYALLQSGQWVNCPAEQLPASSMFAKLTLLLPNHVCAYRVRTFPQHLLTPQELPEAIALDYPNWSPWGQASGYCYRFNANGDDWQVSIWAWDKHFAQNLVAQLPFCTHIIPELAWHAACVPPQPTLLIIAEQPPQPWVTYLLLGDAGTIQASARITEQPQAKRCWHGWGIPTITQGYTINQTDNCWIPDNISVKALPTETARPSADLLRTTRIPGTLDWLSPKSYRQIIILGLILLTSWMVADALVLNYQMQQIRELSLLRNSAHDVLKLREQVEASQRFNQQAITLQKQQRLPEELLAQLSTQIPSDIYLKSVRFDGDQLDLEGQGKQVTRLLVILETLPGVSKVMLSNDIRRNPQTDEEMFQIRLILNNL